MRYTIEHDEHGKIKAINAYYGPAEVKALCWTLTMEEWGTSVKRTLHPMANSETATRHKGAIVDMFENIWDSEHLGE